MMLVDVLRLTRVLWVDRLRLIRQALLSPLQGPCSLAQGLACRPATMRSIRLAGPHDPARIPPGGTNPSNLGSILSDT